jgi:hypothetical protein
MGQQPKSARRDCIYFNDDGDLVENWKLVLEEQRMPGTLAVRAEPFTKLRVAKFFNLRADPYEQADITSNTYYDRLIDHAYLAYGAEAAVAKFLARGSGRLKSVSAVPPLPGMTGDHLVR